MTITLNKFLQGQDLNPDKVCGKVLNNTFDPTADLLTALLVEIHEKNEMGYDLNGIETDLNYYIGQLKKAKLSLFANIS